MTLPRRGECRFCGEPAIARYALDRGCLCYPDDRQQDLCAQHEARATPLGSMDLVIEYGRPPWLDDGDMQLYHGDAETVLATLPAGSVQTCVTSPPYWGLRDYNMDGQLGLEATPDEYVTRMVDVFRAVRRVLRDDGTVWLNLGDSYAGGAGTVGPDAERDRHLRRSREHLAAGSKGTHANGRKVDGLKPKDLVGIPWRIAFALQTDGWYLRSSIIWSKPNPMPESVTDRPTTAHEYVFLLAKQARYYYDADAIAEPSVYPGDERHLRTDRTQIEARNGGLSRLTTGNPTGTTRNVRSVWEIATQPTPEAHFATYPEELVRRCILAGTSEHGECSACGTPWRRLTLGAITAGWGPWCACGAPVRPQVVLDPFVGSGTTALVARKHGRRAVGIDLNEAYLHIAAKRTSQLSLLAKDGAA